LQSTDRLQRDSEIPGGLDRWYR